MLQMQSDALPMHHNNRLKKVLRCLIRMLQQNRQQFNYAPLNGRPCLQEIEKLNGDFCVSTLKKYCNAGAFPVVGGACLMMV
ncbi:hypothetical protein ACJJIK_07565 [Microbulbifer sp. ZKSA006]|uniref:hypothetical protein n=1 Tax=Microbulbifer sp. ZKSA006 TaxID=3243390 RepID=UPI00403A5083